MNILHQKTWCKSVPPPAICRRIPRLIPPLSPLPPPLSPPPEACYPAAIVNEPHSGVEMREGKEDDKDCNFYAYYLNSFWMCSSNIL